MKIFIEIEFIPKQSLSNIYGKLYIYILCFDIIEVLISIYYSFE